MQVENFTALAQQVQQYLPLLGLGLLVMIGSYYLSAPLSRWLIRPLNFFAHSQLIAVVGRRALRLLLILLGVYIFLRLAGLTEFAVAVISGTGMVGLILGFAFKDIAENFIASILLSVQRPFRLGDVIEVEGQTGVIKQVTSRATTIVDYDGNHIQIPNATIYKNIIRNFTANANMRGFFDVGIGYDANLKLAQDSALAIMHNHQAVLDDPEPSVLIETLGSSTINLRIYFWVDATRFSVPKVKSALMHLVVKAYLQQNISMPDDARELIFPQGIDVNLNHNEKSETPVAQAKPPRAERVDPDDQPAQDLDTETDEIRQQAAQARDPEQGSNIL